VPQNTGMAGIVPAWKIDELLKSADVQKKLHESEKAELLAREAVAKK
jgi:hypothetical protein